MIRFLILIICLLLPAPLYAQNLAVVEFFTANGCQDTPPIHDNMHEIFANHKDDILLLTCHVTHFRSTEKPESLGLEICDKRHIQYFSNQALDTPEIPGIILNGRFQVPAANKEDIREQLQMAWTERPMERLDLNIEGQDLIINLPDYEMVTPADLWIIGYNKQAEGADGQSYINMVKYIQKLDPWDGEKTTRTYDIKALEDFDRLAILTQRSMQREIFGAGTIALKP